MYRNMYYDHPSNFSHCNIQNIGCNFNFIQTNNEYQYKTETPSYEYSNTMNNTGNMNLTCYPQYSIKNNYSHMNQSQPLTEIFPNSYNHYNYQNFQNPDFRFSGNNNGIMKFDGNIEYNKADMTTGYEVRNCNIVNYNDNVHSQNVYADANVYSLQNDTQKLYYPMSQNQSNENLNKSSNIRKMHPNCTTLVYNRKLSTNSSVPRKFYCSYPDCFKAYMKNSHLKAHMRIHSGEKPHVCKFILEDKTVCNESFSRSDQLTRHRRKHTNERPFSCSFCDKSFFRSDHCSNHQDRCRRKSDRSQKSLI